VSRRLRVELFAGLLALVLAAVTVVAVREAERYRQRHDAAPGVPVTAGRMPEGPRILFRHTGTDRSFGLVAGVPLEDPGGERVISDVACDRVDAVGGIVSCLHTVRGVVTRYELRELDADLTEQHRVSLPGIPSRTRLSPGAGLVATTTFVSGHSYLQTGFSTATEIRDVGGEGHGNLERFTLVLDGEEVRPTDRNLWGVTFLDERTFYATAATGGRTYLVRGDLATRTLTGLRENAECPSLSPDGSRLAYKVDDAAAGTHWSFAVLDLATGTETLLRGEAAGVDDQAAWLDEDTILYGLPRTEEPGVTDVWALDTTATAEPRLLIEQAWSPAVVR